MCKLYVILIELCMRGVMLLALKGNKSCKTYNITIEVVNVQMIFFYLVL